MLTFFSSHSLYTIKPPKNNLSLEIKTELRCLFQTSIFLHVHHGDVQTLQPQLLVRFRFLRRAITFDNRSNISPIPSLASQTTLIAVLLCLFLLLSTQFTFSSTLDFLQ